MTITYSVSSGTTIPAGLTFTPGSNQLKITGTPRANGFVFFSVTAKDSAGNTASQAFEFAISSNVKVSPAALSTADVGAAYNQSLTASGGSGVVVTLSYAVTSGAIPDGLKFNPSGDTLTISGTPTAGGKVEFNVIAKDAAGDTNTFAYTLVANAVVLSPVGAVSIGTTGVAYNQTINASGGSGAITLTYSVPYGAIPAGLSVSVLNNQLKIGGTPTAVGEASLSVTATDKAGNITGQSYGLVVNAAPTPNLPPPLPDGQVGESYSQSIFYDYFTPLSGAYKITSGSIPAGLFVNAAHEGLSISGRPTASGSVGFTVTAAAANGSTTTQNYVLTINPADAPTLTPPPLPEGDVGTSYKQTISASGVSGSVTVKYTVTSGAIPFGLTFTLSGSQLTISGTPQAAGTINFNVVATDKAGNTAMQGYALTINPALTLSSSTLPAGNVGTSYCQYITASGGSGALTVSYTVTAGSIPAGLSFAPGTSELAIFGTPSAKGSVTFSVTDTDEASLTVTQSYTLTINPATSLTLVPSYLGAANIGTPYNQTITTSGGSGTVKLKTTLTSSPCRPA